MWSDDKGFCIKGSDDKGVCFNDGAAEAGGELQDLDVGKYAPLEDHPVQDLLLKMESENSKSANCMPATENIGVDGMLLYRCSHRDSGCKYTEWGKISLATHAQVVTKATMQR